MKDAVLHRQKSDGVALFEILLRMPVVVFRL